MRLHNRAGVASSERELYFPELRDPGKADRGVVRGESQHESPPGTQHLRFPKTDGEDKQSATHRSRVERFALGSRQW